jgi:hypothetical protein
LLGRDACLRGNGRRGTSLIRNCHLLGPYSRLMPRALWWSGGEGLFRMSEVPPVAGTMRMVGVAILLNVKA